MVKKACKDGALGTLLEKQTGAVAFIRKSNNANRMLREQQVSMHASNPDPIAAHHVRLNWKSYPSSPVRLVMRGKTRWWSTMKQNKRFVRLRTPLEKVFQDLVLDGDIKQKHRLNMEYTEHDWSVMEQLVGILNPFKDAIKEMEGNICLLFPFGFEVI
jgi:hypothetical protein